ncbi:MAG: hypothetical protein HYR96_13550 [Deltaproteobacteria bacterium]|nr:hypothetical protein [Deltaproteobacteria bacterium]MBI3293928.1 hypothetical protein [Deltaproteobacteria bacterium]
MTQASFVQDVATYVGRVRLFQYEDWLRYTAWVGLMMGLFFSTTYFVLFGAFHGVEFPAYVWNVPLGVFIFVVAIAFDTIGHRTVYKEELSKGENLVHHITIFAGITSIVTLVVGYHYPSFCRYPAMTLIALAIFYSAIDEALHWRRYIQKHSDRVEMWSHFFIFLGHIIMSLAWWRWFDDGYPGVRATLIAMGY